MKIAIWHTGHHIADTVADAVALGLPMEGLVLGNNTSQGKLPDWFRPELSHIGYGILRGMDEIFKASDNWFNIDRGYFNPGHFDGYYRISFQGTQAKWHADIPQQALDFKLEDWREDDEKKEIVICPPTQAVCDFFNIPAQTWLNMAYQKAQDSFLCPIIAINHKSDGKTINWDETRAVITFNSSIGWQALQRGIPVYSDPDHSIIGSYYKAKMKNPIDFLSDEYRAIDRGPLFRAMRSHQFTLKEISEGKAWPLIEHYLTKYSSATIAGNKPPPKSPPIV